MTGALTNHLWQSTLFAGAAGLLTAAFRKNRANVRYWLWFAASLKFLVPLALLLSLGGNWHWAPAARVSATRAVSATMSQIVEPFSETVTVVSPKAAATDWSSILMLTLWACGFAAIALIRVRAWLRIRTALQRSERVAIPAAVEVRAAPGLLEPGGAGWLRPILLVPAGITERLTAAQLEAVLAHELCHVRRRDNLFAAIHMAVEAVFWFHPLVWWIGARLVEERELACDEGVLALGSEPHVYAEAILSVCKLDVESPLACVPGVTGADLRRRIEAIMANRRGQGLNRAKKVLLAAAAAAALAGPVVIGLGRVPAIRAQSGEPIPKFEVASIKLSQDCGVPGGGMEGPGAGMGKKKGGGRSGGGSSPGRLSTCATVESLVNSAYTAYADGRVMNRQARLNMPPVSGGPPWIHTDRYLINAKADGPVSQEMMMGPMMQALLEDRFKLQIRREAREVPVYVLNVSKGGAKLQPSPERDCIPLDQVKGPVTPGSGPRPCVANFHPGGAGMMKLDAQGITLDLLSKLLSVAADRPVMDKTGIEGRYDFSFEMAIDDSTPNFVPRDNPGAPVAAASDPAGPSLFTAIQRFGLKLEPARGPREFLVIDHVERPTEN